MNLKDAYKFSSADFMAYSRPNSYELVGKGIDLSFDSGRKTTLTLAFAADSRTALTVTLSDGLNDQPAECLKIGGEIFLVNFAIENFGATYILDYKAGLATHVVIGGDKPMEDFGFIVGAAGDESIRHALSDDIDGNTVSYSFSPTITASVKYTKDNAGITMPMMPPIAIPGFKAIRLAEGIYFQYGQIALGPTKVGLFLAADYNSVLFDGALFGVPGLPPLGTIGGYGKITAYEG